MARGRFRRGDLEALLGVRAACDRAREATRREAGRRVPSRVRRPLRELPDARGRDSRAAPVPARARQEEVTGLTSLLQELIRIDTTNPPGNETAAAELL